MIKKTDHCDRYVWEEMGLVCLWAQIPSRMETMLRKKEPDVIWEINELSFCQTHVFCHVEFSIFASAS